MSKENVELVRRAYAAFNRWGSRSGSRSLRSEHRMECLRHLLDRPRTYHGRRTWQEEFFPDLMEVFEGYRAEPEELIDAGEQVVAVVRGASIVFAVIVIEESQLPHEHLIVLAIYLTVGLSVFAHGLTAAPLANRYAYRFEHHPRDVAPPMESAPIEVTRTRGLMQQSSSAR